MSSYSWVLDKIKATLVSQGSSNKDKLTDNDIKKSIKAIKETLREIEAYASSNPIKIHILNGHNYEKLLQQDWHRIERDIKSTFKVRFDPGAGIKGKKQRKRNTSWWTDDYRHKENYYWDRYKKFLGERLNQSIMQTTDSDTTFVLDNIGNPKEDGFSIYGMVVGHVQSGKTANYSGVLCKAADAGYKFIVVIAGDKNNLRNQTQERVDESFIGWSSGEIVGVGFEDSDNSKRPVPFTTIERDFDIKTGQSLSGITYGQFKPPVILVVKKNGSILKNLIKWLKSETSIIENLPMLVIDDESDYASVNTKTEDSPASINSKIRELIQLSKKSSYIAYTATPFANIFIDYQAEHKEFGQDLFPRDFIYSLNAPTNYFGSDEILSEAGRELYISEIDDYQDVLKIKHKKDDPLYELPSSLYESIRYFVLAVTIRSMRGQESKHKSMLVHISRFTNKHMEARDLVGEYLNELVDDINTYSRLNGNIGSLTSLRKTFEQEFVEKIDSYNSNDGENEFNLEFTWDQVKQNLSKYSKTIKIREVHQDAYIQLEYDDKDPINVIVIGGLSLSRGFTLEGLTVSYFLRGTLFYDTLMQMARWYGYRIGYQDLCRIYMSEDMIDNYIHIHEASIDLMSSFKEMVKQGRTPEEFGLAVQEHPDNLLKVTARGKMSNTETQNISVRLEGTLRETVRMNSDSSVLKKNYSVVSNILEKLQNNYTVEKVTKGSFLWRNVSQNLVTKLLRDFIVYDGDGFGNRSKMPILFVREFAENNDNWDVALYGGRGEVISIAGLEFKKEIRSLHKRDDFYALPSRQLSSENAEAISLPDEQSRKEGSKDRIFSRKYKGRNNLLMLHIVQRKKYIDSEIACFGVSFSGDGMSSAKNITIRMNRVMIQERDSAIKENRGNVE